MADVASESGHWYKKDGSPFYTMIGKNGKERNVTLRDARKVEAGPSVSMIMGCAASPALTNYFKNQVALAAAENPRDPEEGVQAYMNRILACSREHTETARDKGTAIHGEIERALVETVWIPSLEACAAIEALGKWCGHGGLYCERSFYHRLGYGGKCDVHKPGFVADFKTKEFTADNLPAVYDNHAQQLAAYREGFNMPNARCAIIYVSTSVPGLTHTVEIDQDELSRGWEMFCTLLRYWKLKNNYYPEPGKEQVNGQRERTFSSVKYAQSG
jgi:hypothetical protein